MNGLKRDCATPGARRRSADRCARTWIVRLTALGAAWLLLGLGAGVAAERRPDFSGVWTNTSVTQLVRPKRVKALVLSKAEAEAYAKADPLVRVMDSDSGPSDPQAGAPPSGEITQGYNAFWVDAANSLALVKGQYRTSWIVDPEDGQLPLSEAGRLRVAKTRVDSRTDLAEGPEALAPSDRCLISSRGAGGPGMLNTIYNGNYQILQTPGYVVIVVEQVHDARIIPLFADRAAAVVQHGVTPKWLGDSVGWWEGATLVVETVGVHPEQGARGPIFLTPQGRVTERFSEAGKSEIFYEFRVEDPAYYSRPWRAEMTLTANPNPLFEFACHEGNYAMGGILGGARAEEAASREARPAAQPR